MLEQSTLQISSSIAKKISTSLIAGVVFSALVLMLGNGGGISWFPPIIVFSLIGITLWSILLFPFIWHYLEKKQKMNSEKVYGFLYGVIRYCIAFNIGRILTGS